MRLRARALSLYERAESPDLRRTDFRVYARYRAAFIARAQDGRAEGFHCVSIGGPSLRTLGAAWRTRRDLTPGFPRTDVCRWRVWGVPMAFIGETHGGSPAFHKVGYCVLCDLRMLPPNFSGAMAVSAFELPRRPAVKFFLLRRTLSRSSGRRLHAAGVRIFIYCDVGCAYFYGFSEEGAQGGSARFFAEAFAENSHPQYCWL